jgi:hypothetical protein
MIANETGVEITSTFWIHELIFQVDNIAFDFRQFALIDQVKGTTSHQS